MEAPDSLPAHLAQVLRLEVLEVRDATDRALQLVAASPSTVKTYGALARAISAASRLATELSRLRGMLAISGPAERSVHRHLPPAAVRAALEVVAASEGFTIAELFPQCVTKGAAHVQRRDPTAVEVQPDPKPSPPTPAVEPPRKSRSAPAAQPQPARSIAARAPRARNVQVATKAVVPDTESVESFLARGGEIERLPAGATSQPLKCF